MTRNEALRLLHDKQERRFKLYFIEECMAFPYGWYNTKGEYHFENKEGKDEYFKWYSSLPKDDEGYRKAIDKKYTEFKKMVDKQ
jgi:hypothetical protein